MPKYVLVLCVVLALSFPSAISAFSSTDSASPETIRERVRSQIQLEIKPTREAVQEQTREQVQQRVNAACDNVTARIENRITQYESNKDKWMTRHQGVLARLSSLTEKLEARGCDATAIREDADKYQVLVTNFAAASRLFHDTLQDSRQYACSESQGNFAGKLKQSRVEVQAVRTSATALKDFFNNSLKLHLRQIGAACVQASEGTQ